MSQDDIGKRAQIALDKAQRLHASGDSYRAGELLQKFLEMPVPDDEPETRRSFGKIWATFGTIQEALGQEDEALRAYERAVAIDGDLTDAGFKVVEKKIDSGEAMSRSMVPHYVEYAVKGPNKQVRQGALRRLQRILQIRLGDAAEDVGWRMEMIERIHHVLPTANFPKLYLGRGHYVQGDYQNAIRYFGLLSGTSAETANILNILGRCHEKVSQLTEAKAAYEKSLRTDPNQGGICFRLGRVELKLAEVR